MSISLSQDLPVVNYADYSGAGIWAGLFYSMAGIFGLAACQKRSGPLYVFYMK